MSDIYQGEICGPCFREDGRRIDATHKVAQELPPDLSPRLACTHGASQYVCCLHFERLFGIHTGICALKLRAAQNKRKS